MGQLICLVRHDFESWLPKLSANAVVRLHDANVRENSFGVSKFWEELSSAHKGLHFDFLHGHGLGVLGFGFDYCSPLRLLFDADQNKLVGGVRQIFASIGRLSALDGELRSPKHALPEREAQLSSLQSALAEREAQLSSLQSTISALYASSSWRASAPLRAGKRLFEGMRMRLSALARRRVPRE